MSNYNKQDATRLYEELQEEMNSLSERIKTAKDDGPVIKIICESLGKAIAALKTTIR